MTWIAGPGEEGKVREILVRVAAETRREPGYIRYAVHQAKSEPGRFVLYNVYRDSNVLRAHSESDHFKRDVVGEAVAAAGSRERIEVNVIGGKA